MLLYSTQKLCDMMISMERLADATSSDLANFASALWRLQLTSKVERRIFETYIAWWLEDNGVFEEKIFLTSIENLSICLAKNDMYLTMLGWSNFSSCFSREISRRMAIGTPSSVSENRIFFKATICSLVLSRAR